MDASPKINLDLVPHEVKARIIRSFARGYQEFWADPANEAEFQEWRRQRMERGEA